MSKIKNAFQNGKAFIAFLTAGDPSADKTVEYILDMEEAGADLVEIGIPFSDPTAEGVVIQEANIRDVYKRQTAGICQKRKGLYPFRGRYRGGQ